MQNWCRGSCKGGVRGGRGNATQTGGLFSANCKISPGAIKHPGWNLQKGFVAVSKFIVSDSFSISLVEPVHLPGGAVAMVRLLGGGPSPRGKEGRPSG